MPRATISVVMSVRPYGTTRLQVDGFSWHLIFDISPKICRGSSSYVKICPQQAALYMNTSVHLWKYPAEFFWERENFQIKIFRKSKYTFCVQETSPLPPENSTVYEIMWLNSVQPDRPLMVIWRGTGNMRYAGPTKKAGIQTHTHNPHLFRHPLTNTCALHYVYQITYCSPLRRFGVYRHHPHAAQSNSNHFATQQMIMSA